MRYLITTFLLLCCVIPSHINAETYSFAFVPQQSAKKLAKKWTPILNYINEHTGDTYVFTTAKNIPTFEQRVQAQDYDVAYMNPYHFVVFNQSAGYQALAKQKNKQIKGIVVVKKDSDIKTLEQLEQMKLAFPAPAAFAASILPRGELQQRGIEFTPKYVSSHDSVYLNVARGFFPAGGGVMRTFNNTAPEVREKLKVLWSTNGYTPHAFATKQDFPQEAAKRLIAALESMNTTEKGKALLKTVNFKGLEAAQNDDWRDVKSLDLDTILGNN